MNGWSTLLAQAAADQSGLTVAGGLIMTLSIGLVLGLMVFCLGRILREPQPEQHHHAPLEIDTHDIER